MKVQHRHATRLHDPLDGRECGAVEVTFELSVLQKPVLFHVTLKLLPAHKVVVVAVHLARTNQSSGICIISKKKNNSNSIFVKRSVYLFIQWNVAIL